MIALISDIIVFIIDMIKLALGLAWGMLEFIFGLLGGVFSFILGMGGFILALALVMVGISRRSEYKQRRQTESDQKVYDVDTEEFTSFYDQYRTETRE